MTPFAKWLAEIGLGRHDQQGINAAARFDKSLFPCDRLSRLPASRLGDNLTHG
jgi:hypothetical protein